MKRRLGLCCIVALMLTAASGCSDDEAAPPPGPSDGMRVASFDFPESVLLAEMFAQVIESVGIPVVRVGEVGPREIVAPALELDQIDVVPEYLGTARQYFGATDPVPDTAAALADLRNRLSGRGLTVLAPARAQDKNVFAVKSEFAEEADLVTISDLAPLAADLRFGGTPECPNRPLCLAGLETVYGLQFAEFVPQRDLRFTAEALRRDEIDVGLMFSTAAELVAFDLVVLDDDLSMQPAENIVPVVRSDALARWGAEIGDALDALSEQLTTRELRFLNVQVDNEVPVETVAGDWLTKHQLLGSS